MGQRDIPGSLSVTSHFWVRGTFLAACPSRHVFGSEGHIRSPPSWSPQARSEAWGVYNSRTGHRPTIHSRPAVRQNISLTILRQNTFNETSEQRNILPDILLKVFWRNIEEREIRNILRPLPLCSAQPFQTFELSISNLPIFRSLTKIKDIEAIILEFKLFHSKPLQSY